jgi:signal transduction histidine kinase
MTQPMYRAGPHAPVAYSHLANSLRKASARICDTWGAAVRRELPGADGPTFAGLRDQVPRALSTLADIVGGGKADPAMAPATGRDTAPVANMPPSYRIDEAVIEWGLLRRTVFEELPGQLGRSFLDDEVVVVNEYLDGMVSQAVAAHGERQARELQAATDGQSKYLSFLSHDLRGGLNGIFLMVEVLRRELAGRAELAETLEDLEIMRRSILETVATMDRFLYAERFRKGKVKVRPMPMSLRSLLVEIGSRFTYAAKDQGIELKVDVADRAEVVSDRELLALAIHGLVANAVKQTTRGTVLMTAKPLPSGGWKVEVIDSGAGIAPELLEEIRAGFQDPSPGKPGPGLGLSLAAQACRLIGATLGAESRAGAGSRFWVEVPRGAGTLV